MEQLPPHLARFALPLLAALGLIRPAAAQLPVNVPVPVPVPESPPASTPTPTPAPVAPTPQSGTNPPPSASQPTPAKADHLKEPPITAAEAAVDDEADFEEEGSAADGPRRTWYGWQTLTADGISTLLFFAGASLSGERGNDTGDTLAWTGLAAYEFAPSIVHFAHRNPGRAFASMGIRLGMPLAGAFVGAAAASGCSGYECEAGGAAVGLLLGMGGAIAIDAAVLAFDYPEPTTRAARVLPVVSLGPGRAVLGLAGEL